jgi:Domain of unknown function (DUF4129)
MDLSVVRRWWPLAAVVALLAVASLAAAHSTPQLDRIPDANRSEATPPTPQEQPTTSPDATVTPGPGDADSALMPSWLSTLLGGLVLLLLAGFVLLMLVGLISMVFRRRYGERPLPADAAAEPSVDAAEVVAAVDAGLVDLSDTDRDPRRAVIACWLRLEEAAQAAGVPRGVGDTSTDLVTRLLTGGADGSGLVVSADVLAGFAEVYREARYATHTVDERMREQARAALVRLRAELTGVAA